MDYFRCIQIEKHVNKDGIPMPNIHEYIILIVSTYLRTYHDPKDKISHLAIIQGIQKNTR